jgi:nitrous oxidase accessory protein
MIGLRSLGNVLQVGSNQEFQSIAKAIETAEDGDSILVFSGEYREGNLLIEKELSLIGVGLPVLDGENKYEIITVTSDHVFIQGFRIQAVGRSYMADYAAIHLKRVRHCSILDTN